MRPYSNVLTTPSSAKHTALAGSHRCTQRARREVPMLRVPLGGMLLAATLAAVAQTQPPSKAQPPGEEKTAKTRVLELGAKALQGNAPVAKMDIYLNGFHPMKENPGHQMEAHHFCQQMNQDFAQCALFDGNRAEANLTGIEYIISEKLFATLPEAERRYWHPHNGEILSGQLIAPGIPQVAEHALMKDKMNSYGKTWHVWNTGMSGAAGDKLPFGEPMLAWSFNRDGEAAPGLVEQRDNASERRQPGHKACARRSPTVGTSAVRRR